mmetsp:Transcript_20101/g.54793  ORF Transcript_20101/g.54793 Transcript_20101/m.54793 type:complete len:383 (+) Transcript_20101:492-1640(+)
MREGDLGHQGARVRIVERVLAVVVGREHELHPSIVHDRRGFACLDGLDQDPGDDEGHGVVGGLAGLGVLLSGVADDAKRRLVGHDVDVVDGIGAARGEVRVVHQSRDEALQGAGGLVLVEAELEVHTADRKVGAGVREDKVEGARAWAPADLVAQGDVDDVLAGGRPSRGLEEAEDGLGVAEDVARAHEAAHRPAHREHRRLGGEGCGGALGVGELLARADRAEGHVVRHGHADGALDLLFGGAQERSVHGGGADGSVHDVVDLVALEAEDLSKAPPDLVQADHRAECLLPVDLARHLRGGHDHWVEVVVAELARRVPRDLGVVAKDGAVGVPLAHRRGVRADGLLRGATDARAKDTGALGVWVRQRLLPEHRGRVGLERQG